MRLAVVGAGAMGGALAAEASLAGHEVHIVDVSRELVERVITAGLEVRSGEATVTAHPSATTDAGTVGPVEVVVVFVKAQHTRSAAQTIRALRGDDTVVLSLQNGWGNADVLAEELGTARLAFGVTYHSCSLVEPGVVQHSGRGDTVVGPYESGDDDAAARAADVLTSSGWSTTVSGDVRTDIWKKLILNAATLPTAALTGLNAGALGRSEAMRPVLDGLTRESCAVARAMGLPIDVDERIERIQAVLAGAGTGKASMLQDIDARRKTEIEVINGAVAKAGSAHGVATPINDLMVALIAGLEGGWAE